MINYKSLLLAAVVVIFFPFAVCAKPSSIVIPEVKMAAPTTHARTQSQSVATTHLSSSDIQTSPVVDLRQLLRQEQSIIRLTNTTGDATQPAFSLRGFGDNAAGNSVILVDGFPLTNPSLLSPNFNAIPLNDIERVDIIQGSQGTLWGDQAVGGVVNIITRHPKKRSVDTMVSSGSYQKNYVNVLLADKAASGWFFKTFAQAAETQNYRQHSAQRDQNGSAQAGLDYASGTVSFNVQHDSDTTYLPGATASY
jgi:iron complex outermembrane receptor protein